ncbi:MAG: ABC transporter substrate-binding protein [Thermoplasmatota archaeon]
MRAPFAVAAVLLLIGSGFVSTLPTARAQTIGSDTLVIALQQDIGNYNAFDLGSNTAWKNDVTQFIYDSLSGVDTTGEVYPYLAQSWTTIGITPGSSDYLNVTVALRPGVLFSDGTPLTTDDVVFSYQALRDASTTVQPNLLQAFDWDRDGALSLSDIDRSVVKVDDLHVTFHLATRYGQFYKQTLGIPIIPKHIWQNHLRQDPSCELCIDTQWNGDTTNPGKDILVGSGPFAFASAVPGSRYVLERNDLFWGKTFHTPAGHGVYPTDIQFIEYDIYSSLDSAILALRSGKVDHIPWTITPGEIPSLATDPSAHLTFVSDNGYFYLAFNEKRAPMNDRAFRAAMSHLVDERTVVDVYMGGLGREGDSVEPPFWSEWYNSSLPANDYDLQVAKQILRTAGYRGSALGNSDSTALLGPDGNPVPPIVLLTPPADYDPVRIKTGEFLAKNMRALGIDVSAKAIDFNTLAGRMNGFDYDMLIIGWQLGADPVSNVCDIFGAQATQNYFGFWNPDNGSTDNPNYATIGGVSTLADAPTRLDATRLSQTCALARSAFDPSVQVQAVKDAQGIISDALPVDVLYYRTNAYATSTQYNGWVVFLGNLLNVYSIAALTRGPPVVGGPQGDASIFDVLSAPSAIAVGMTRNVSVAILSANGVPEAGANVTVSITGDSALPSLSYATADAHGLTTFGVRGLREGSSSLYVNATSNGVTASAEARIVVTPAGPAAALFLEGTPARNFLPPGEWTTIRWLVRNETGAPVPHATISVDQNLLSYGCVTPANVTTGPDGTAAMRYDAPEQAPLNAHASVDVIATPSLQGVPAADVNTVSLPLVIRNSQSPDWDIVTLRNPSAVQWAATNSARNVTLEVGDAHLDGTPVAHASLAVVASHSQVFDVLPSTVTTGADGTAWVNLTWAAAVNLQAAAVTVREPSPNAMPLQLSLLDAPAAASPATNASATFGGYVAFSGPILDPDASASSATGAVCATVHLFNSTGRAPRGSVPLTVVVGGTPFGQMATLWHPANYSYSSIEDGASIQVHSVADGQNFPTSGVFAGTLAASPSGAFANWSDLEKNGFTSVNTSIMAPIVAKNGTATFAVTPQDRSLADLAETVTVVPEGVLGYFVTPDQNNYYWTLSGETALEGSLVSLRTQRLTAVQWSTDRPVLQRAGALDGAIVSTKVVDQNNSPLSGADVRVYWNGLKGPSSWPYSVAEANATNSTGTTTTRLLAKAGAKWFAQNGALNTFQQDDEFIQASIAGYWSATGSSNVLEAPIAASLSLSIPGVRFEDPTPNVTLTIQGSDQWGRPLSNWTVDVTATKGTLEGLTNGTIRLGSNGTSVITYHPPEPTIVPWALAAVDASASEDGYAPVTETRELVAVNDVPTISITQAAQGLSSNSRFVNLTGTASDADGIESLAVRIDDGASNPVPIATGLRSTGFVWPMGPLSVGPHTITVQARDGKGFENSAYVTVTILPQPAPAAHGTSILGVPGPGFSSVLAALGVACVVLARRKR